MILDDRLAKHYAQEALHFSSMPGKLEITLYAVGNVGHLKSLSLSMVASYLSVVCNHLRQY